MVRALYTAASGMTAQQLNVDTISNNLANVNTVGYKKETTNFKSLLYTNLRGPENEAITETTPSVKQVGHFIPHSFCFWLKASFTGERAH